MASPFGTIHASLFTFPSLVTADAPGIRLASLDLDSSDVTGSIASRGLIDTRDDHQFLTQVNRVDKGDRLVPAPRPAPPAPQSDAANLAPPADAPVKVPLTVVTAPGAPPAAAADQPPAAAPQSAAKADDDTAAAAPAQVATQPPSTTPIRPTMTTSR
jgi:hypothetical protein